MNWLASILIDYSKDDLLISVDWTGRSGDYSGLMVDCLPDHLVACSGQIEAPKNNVNYSTTATSNNV